MSIRTYRFTILFLVLLVAAPLCRAEVRLPKIFGNNMVLQRDLPLHFWGWASPGEEVKVVMGVRTVSVKGNSQGKWSCVLPAMPAGGPYEVVVNGTNRIELKNILIGDVWICGGQSNMQWRLDQTPYEEKDSVLLKRGNIRLFTVPFDMDYQPREDVKGNGWQTLSLQTIREFSAVGYHFGKYLYEHLDVPIGLVSDNLGATAAEAWMSNETLLQFPEFTSLIQPVVKHGKSFDALTADFEKNKAAWFKKYYYKSAGVKEQWFKPETNVADWKPINASGNTWENEPDLKDHDGEVWFRTTFDLPENYRDENFNIALSQIDDYDLTWVNGVKIGETYGKHNHRNYSVPTRTLKPKGNVLVVRVFDVGGIGGFTTSPFWGSKILLGNWLYKKGEAIDPAKFQKVEMPNATPFSSPGVLYNGSIAPLTSFPIKGVIWYQGESNADRAYEYRELFPALIRDWRKHWNQGDFPFLFVQLANYMDESKEPSESHWAELREAQTLTLSLPNTGMACAIDIGEAQDIHPKNKLDVGKRLGLAAMKVAYGKNVVASGPSFKSMRVNGDRLIVSYDNAGSGLLSKDKYGYLRGFQVAGADKKFHWAQARIVDGKVEVVCDQVRQPIAVRYSWDNNPGPLDLYNAEGLPAVPFRTDTFKGSTEGQVFVEGPRF
ncbi:MAG TPA: sialate O-acetylesterase [Chryseolinea sp.]